MLGWLWRRKWKTLLITATLAFIALNFFTWRHARAMFRFSPAAAERTKSPEDLGFVEKVGVIFNGVTMPKPTSSTTPADFNLEFESFTVDNQRGHQLHAWRIPAEGGAAPIAAIFHGYSACKADLIGVGGAFHEMGCESILLDFYGSGESSGSATSFGYHEAEDIVALLEQLPEDRKVILYGLSMGGAAITRACADLGAKPDAIIIESVFPNFRETVAMRFRAMDLPATPAADLLIFWGGVDLGFWGYDHNPADYAGKIDIPALIFTGKHDARVPLKSVEIMSSNFASDARFHVFDAGHRPFLETHPEKWKSLISGFLYNTSDQ